MKSIILTDLVRKAEVLQKVKGDRKFLQKLKKKANSTGQILHGNSLLIRIIEGKVDGRMCRVIPSLKVQNYL